MTASDEPKAVATGLIDHGGGVTAKGCLDAGLLDEILVHQVPPLLGDGVRLFERPGGANGRPVRLAQTEAAAVANLWFRVIR